MNEIYPDFDVILSREIKEVKLGQKSKVIWFTGLSGSGKTTLASALEKTLFKLGYFSQILDGDNIRSGINNNLSFTEVDRFENIRRIAEVSKLFLNSGIILICAFISPTKDIRCMARDIIGEEDFLEVFVDTPLEICEKRDPKGLYEKARKGELKNFTGVSAPFEVPEQPFLVIDNSITEIQETVNKLLDNLLPCIQLNT